MTSSEPIDWLLLLRARFAAVARSRVPGEALNDVVEDSVRHVLASGARPGGEPVAGLPPLAWAFAALRGAIVRHDEAVGVSAQPPLGSAPMGPDPSVAGYAAGIADPATRRGTEARILESDALAEALYGLQPEAVEAAEVVNGNGGSVGSLGPSGPRARGATALVRVSPRVQRAFLAIAAIVVVVLLAWLDRAPSSVAMGGWAGAAPEAIAPIGELPDPPQFFVWSRSAGATAYRFELYDLDAKLVHRAVVRDTILAAQGLPSDTLAAGFWKVTPIDRSAGERISSLPAAYYVVGR